MTAINTVKIQCKKSYECKNLKQHLALNQNKINTCEYDKARWAINMKRKLQNTESVVQILKVIIKNSFL